MVMPEALNNHIRYQCTAEKSHFSYFFREEKAYHSVDIFGAQDGPRRQICILETCYS